MKKNVKDKIILEISIIIILYILSAYGIYYLAVHYVSDDLSTTLVILLPYTLITLPVCVYGYNLRYRRIYAEPEKSDEEQIPMVSPQDILKLLKVALYLFLANGPLYLGIYTIIALKRPGLGLLIVSPSVILSLFVFKMFKKVAAELTSKLQR